MRPFKILFLCTGNSARSILAEAILNRLGRGKFKALSAGSRPVGRVHPLALALLEREGVLSAGLRSKSANAFAATRFDLVITVCDHAAREPCPAWPGTPLTVHWGLPDPAAVAGTDEEKRAAFEAVFQTLSRRLERLAALPVDVLGSAGLREKLHGLEAL